MFGHKKTIAVSLTCKFTDFVKSSIVIFWSVISLTFKILVQLTNKINKSLISALHNNFIIYIEFTPVTCPKSHKS